MHIYKISMYRIFLLFFLKYFFEKNVSTYKFPNIKNNHIFLYREMSPLFSIYFFFYIYKNHFYQCIICCTIYHFIKCQMKNLCVADIFFLTNTIRKLMIYLLFNILLHWIFGRIFGFICQISGWPYTGYPASKIIAYSKFGSSLR